MTDSLAVIPRIYELVFLYTVKKIKYKTKKKQKRILKGHDLTIFVEKSTIDELQKQDNSVDVMDAFPKYRVFDKIKDEQEIDLAITVGGDGTILWTVSLFQNREVPPIIGFSKVIVSLYF